MFEGEEPRKPDQTRPGKSHSWLGGLISWSRKTTRSVLGLRQSLFRLKWRKGRANAAKTILIKDTARTKVGKRTKRVHFMLPKPKSAGLFRPLHPDSKLVHRWANAMILPLSYEIWAFPFRLAFGIAKFNAAMQADVIFDFAFLIDAMVKCSTTIPVGTLPDQDAAITTFRGIARVYLKRQFLWDFIPPGIYYLFTAVSTVLGLEEDAILWLWWLSTTPRMLVRSMRLTNYFRDMSTNLKINVRVIETVKFMMMIFLSSHWTGCVMYWLSRLYSHDESTWVDAFSSVLPRFNKDEVGMGSMYLICVYSGFNLISGLGYTYGMPKNPLEITWRLITMIFQVYLSSLILGSLLNYIVRNSPEEVAYKRRMDDMVAYVERHKIPPDVASNIYSFMEFQHKKQAKTYLRGLVTLPKPLLVKASNHQYQALVEKCACKGKPLFGCSPGFLDEFLISMEPLHLHPGEPVAKKDDVAWQLYLVVDGAVSLMDDENRVRGVIRADVPDMAPLAGHVPFFIRMFHAYHIRAQHDGEAQLLVLGKEESERLFALFPSEQPRIRDNILASFALDAAGRDTSGVADGEPDAERLTEERALIQAAIQDQTYRSYAVFFSAVENGDVETVQAFIARGMDPNSMSCDRLSALHLASLKGRAKVVSALLDHGARINAKDMWGHTPLWYAISRKLDLVVAVLKERNASLELPRPEAELWEAAATGNLEMVRTLLENKVDPNVETCDGRSAMHVGAGEGKEDVVALLLRYGADINAKDRFGGTPLKDAVMGGHNLLASIMRSKGALLPEGMGADLLCAAASDGAIPLLQLLFECDMDMNVGDYDKRKPLHLAAAEARVLAVSFLLSHTARPNAEDRWGGRAMDDALKGGTTYHMYCAKLIQCWGGKVGIFDVESEEGRERMAELDAIDITDAFNLVEKLLKLGFARKKSNRISEQAVLTCFEATAASIPVVRELRFNAARLCSTLRHRKIVLRKTMSGLDEALKSIQVSAASPMFKRQGARKEIFLSQSVARMAKFNTIRGRRLSEQSADSATWSQAGAGAEENSDLSEGEELDAGLFDPLNALEPEEEEELQVEVDRMQSVMQRCFDSGQTAPQLGAQAFHHASVQVLTICESIQVVFSAFVDFRTEEMAAAAAAAAALAQLDAEPPASDAFKRVGSSVARTQSAGSKRRGSLGPGPSRLPSDPRRRLQVDGLTRLTSSANRGHGLEATPDSPAFAPEELASASEDILWKMIAWLGATVYGDEVEEIMEEAQAFVQEEQQREESERKKNPTADNVVANHSLQPADEHGADNASNPDTPALVPLEAVLAGSRRFRAMCETLQIDANLCKLLESQLSTVLSEDECRRLVVADTIEVKQGVLSLWEEGQHRDVWYVVLEGVLVVQEVDQVRGRRDASDPSGPARAQERSFHAGTLLGAWGTLMGTETNTSVTAVCSCRLLCVEMDSLCALVASKPALQISLARLMAEAPAPEQAEAVYHITEQNVTSSNHDRSGHSDESQVRQGSPGLAKDWSATLRAKRAGSMVRSLAGSLPDGAAEVKRAGELTRMQIKQIMLLLADLWRCLSMGSDKIPLSVLSGIAAKLGEAGNETFRKVFSDSLDEEARAPELQCLTESDYWRRWLIFVAEDNRQVSEVENEKSAAAEEEEEDGDGTALADQDDDETAESVWDRLYARVSTAHSLKSRFYDPSVIDIYEVAFEQVVGDLRKPLPRKKAVEFLSQIFVDFPYEISARNVREFFLEFSEEGARAMSITWVQIRNVLREYRMGVTSREDRLLNGTALNPRSRFLAAWRVLIRFCAGYYLVMVPVRAAFLPWDGMLHPTALATDLPVDLLVLINLVVAANTSYRNSRSAWVTDRFKIFRKVHAAIIIAAIPLDWFAWNAGASSEDAVFYRIPKMLLMLALPRSSSTTQNSARKKIQTMVWVVTILVHTGTCVWFYLGRAYQRWARPAISWYRTEEEFEDISFPRTGYGWDESDSALERYTVSLYWVASTFSVNGIVGQVIPQNLHECVFAMVLMVASMTLYQWTIGEISSIIMNADMHLVRRREEYSVLNNYIHANRLPQHIGKEILQNFNASQNSAVGDQDEAFRNINLRLRTELSAFLYKETLENTRLFEGCSDGFLDSICNIALRKEFTPEAVLFHKTDEVRELFVVLSGSVDVFFLDHAEVPDLSLEEGQTVGELACVFGIAHTRTAKAANERGASCLCIRSEQFLDILQHYPQDEQCIVNNALLSFELRCQELNAGGMSSRASHASTGVTSDGKLSSFQAENSDHQAASDSGCEGSDSENASSSDGDVGKLAAVALAQLKDRQSARMLHILHKAAADGEVDLIKVLLSRMADKAFNQPNELQRTALHAAAVHGRVDVVRFLLDTKADPESQDIHGNTPFNDAVLLGQDQVAELLRTTMADSKLQLPPTKMSSLMTQAAAAGDTSEMKRLIENKAEVNCSNADRRTALHVAASAGHESVVELLLDSNADPAARDKMGWTALDCAVMVGKRAVQDLMNSKGVSMAGERNMETICNLCQLASAGDVDKIKDLVRNGADVGMGDYDMRTPLHLAASCGELAVLDYLLKLNTPTININCMDRFGGTPLDDALRHGNRAAAAALEQKGALSKVDPGQSSLLEEQKQKLKDLLKNTRAPVVLKTVEESDEMAMCNYLKLELSPTFERLGEALHEALRRVLHSLRSVSAAIKERAGKRAVAMTASLFLSKAHGTGNNKLPGRRAVAGPNAAESGSKEASDSPRARDLPPDPSRGISSMSGSVSDPAYGGADAPSSAGTNQDIVIVGADGWHVLDQSLEHGWRSESEAPRAHEPSTESNEHTPGVRRTSIGVTAPRAASVAAEAAGDREMLVQVAGVEAAGVGALASTPPGQGEASLGGDRAGAQSGGHEAVNDHDGNRGEVDSEAGGGGGGEAAQRVAVAQKHWRRLQPKMTLDEGVPLQLPGVVPEPERTDSDDSELRAAWQRDHSKGLGMSVLFTGELEKRLHAQRGEELAKEAEGKEEEEPYDVEIQRSYQIFSKRLLELHQEDEKEDQVALGAIEEWFEYVLNDLQALSKAITALRQEIDSTCNSVPQGLNGSKQRTKAAGVWRMVMRQAWEEMQAQRDLLGESKKLYKTLRREVNGLMKSKKTTKKPNNNNNNNNNLASVRAVGSPLAAGRE